MHWRRAGHCDGGGEPKLSVSTETQRHGEIIISLEELIELLKPLPNQQGVSPSEALWIKLAPSPKARTKYERPVNRIEYRTPNGETIVEIGVDQQGAILGIEISS
jgi:uncharacterized protein YuzE